MPFPLSHFVRLLTGMVLLFVAVTVTRGQDDSSGITITSASGGTLILTNGVPYSGTTTLNTGNANTKDLQQVIQDQGINYVETAQQAITLNGYVDTSYTEMFSLAPGATYTGTVQIPGTITLSPSNGSTLSLSGAALNTNNATGGTLSVNANTTGSAIIIGSSPNTVGTALTVGTLPILIGNPIESPNPTTFALSLSSSSTINFNLPGALNNLAFASINVAGTLNLTVPNAASLAQLNSSSSFTLLTSATPITGQFSNIASGDRLTTTDGSGSFLVTYSGTTLVASDFQPTDGFDGVFIGNGWEESPWFGIYYPSDNSWVYHQQLGYIYVDPSDPTSLYFQNGNLGWCYTTADTFPEIYSYQENAWVQYLPGTTMFYNYSTGLWETY